LSNIVVALSGESNKKVESQVLNLHLSVIQCLILEIYAKIRFDPVVLSSDAVTVSSGTLMTSSLISTNSSNWHTNSNVDIECASLLHLWNSLYSKLSPESAAKQLSDVLKHDEALRFVYILIVSLCNNDKHLSTTDTQLTSNSPALPTILEAAAYFASLSFEHQVMCTIGWQKSLLVQLCKLPFEYFQHPTIRFHLLIALIVILLDNREGINLCADFITPSWMVNFLKELLSPDATAEDRRRFAGFVPEARWRSALEFFENANV